MGEALLAGLIGAGWAPADELAVAEKVEARRDELAVAHPGLRVVADPIEAAGAIVAVKPGDVPAACRAIAAAGTGRVLSIAAGIPLATLEAALGAGIPVVRAMPNTPALIGAGAAAIAGGSAATVNDLDWAEGLLRAVGTVVRVPEHLLDAVTGLSGSGPAYVFLVAEALIEGGVLAGLPRDISVELATHTLVGAARCGPWRRRVSDLRCWRRFWPLRNGRASSAGPETPSAPLPTSRTLAYPPACGEGVIPRWLNERRARPTSRWPRSRRCCECPT
jgi:pyrroline-5-carboxylate reductase